MQKITDKNDWYWKDPSARAYGAEPTWKNDIVRSVVLSIVPKQGLSALPPKVERSEIDHVMSQIDIDKSCYRLSYGKNYYYFGSPSYSTPHKEYICNTVEFNVNYILGENYNGGKEPEDLIEVGLVKDALQRMLDTHFPDWEVKTPGSFNLHRSTYNPRVLKKCLKHDIDSHVLDIDTKVVYAKENVIKCARIRKIEWDDAADDVKYTLSNGDVTYFKQNPVSAYKFRKAQAEETGE